METSSTVAPSERELRLTRVSSDDRVNVGERERWVSITAGSALAAYGLSRRSWRGLALAAVGGELVRRGLTRQSTLYRTLGVDTAHPERARNVVTAVMPGQPIEVERSVTIGRPREEIYRVWRDFTNLPRFMEHLESVTMLDDRRSRWTVASPIGKPVQWDAEITDEVENEHIAWRSMPESGIDTTGTVRFADAPGARGTEVTVRLRYGAPAGKLGAALATLRGENPEQQVREDLRHFKQIMEAGESPTTQGQPSGRR
jgi:uncharacterized membrane protein